jgi:hypothetical protein
MERAEAQKATGVVDTSSYMKNKKWLVGMSLIILDSILDLVTFGLAPQSLLAPMAALTLVYNTLLAPVFLKESLAREDLIGTGFIAAGIILVVWFAEKETPEYTITEIRALYQTWNATMYFIIVGSFLGVTYFLTRAISKNTKQVLQNMDPLRRKLYPFTYPILAGSFGGQSVLFAKAVVELVKTTFTVSNQFIYPEMYFFVALLAVSLYCQTMFLNSGLKRFDSLFVVPVYQVAWIISGIAGGGVFYQEFNGMSGTEIIMFVSGCLVTFFGVRFISMREHNWETDDGSEDSATVSTGDDLGASLLSDTEAAEAFLPEPSDGNPTDRKRGSSIFTQPMVPPSRTKRSASVAANAYTLGTTAQAMDDLFNMNEVFVDEDAFTQQQEEQAGLEMI